MYDFDDAPVGVNFSARAEYAVELVEHIRLISRPETRELLDRHTGDTFRCHQIDATNPRSVIGSLKTAYLIESANVSTGKVTDWTATERAAQILDIVDDHSVYITETEASSLLQVGAPVWLLPSPDVWWTTADVDVDLYPRELQNLADAGLIEREIDTQDGYSSVWRVSPRLHNIACVVWQVVTDDE